MCYKEDLVFLNFSCALLLRGDCFDRIGQHTFLHAEPGMLSPPRGQHGLKAKFFGLSFGLVASGLGLVLGLVQRWPRSHLGWPRGLVANHHKKA